MPVRAKLGGKITDSHTTMTEASAEVVDLVHKSALVTKISLGNITHVRGGRRDLKFHTITGGIKGAIRGNGAVQDIYIYTKNIDKVIKIITEKFKKSP